jgi:hypothetical protein
MGKAADNERIKLDAAFYNNIAVGTVIAGVLAPYFAFFQVAISHREAIAHLGSGPTNWKELQPILLVFLALLFTTFAALAYASFFRTKAHKLIGKIQG